VVSETFNFLATRLRVTLRVFLGDAGRRWILNKRDMRQPRAAESQPQLEALLQHLLIVVLLGRVFNGNYVVSPTNFAPLLGFGLPLLWDLDKLRRRHWLGDELRQVILQEAQHISTTTLM
jgi:hypothetical protein